MYSYAEDKKLGADLRASFCPSADSPPQIILAWLKNMRMRHTTRMKASPNFKLYEEALKLLSRPSDDPTGREDKTSSLSFNRTKRHMLEMVATLSDVGPQWQYGTEDPEIEAQTSVLTSYFQALWNHPHTKTRRTLVELFQYAICSEAYLGVTWESDPFRRKSPTLKFTAHNIEEVFFSEQPKDKDIQKIHATSIKHELPMTTACLLYPAHAQYFKRDNHRPSWIRRVLDSMRTYESEALEASYQDAAKRGGVDGGNNEGTVNIYHTYVLDISYNNTSKPIEMGDVKLGCNYTVPFVGQQIDTGINDESGRPVTRKADPTDAMLYPYRRLIIHTDDHIISDTSSPWAHGMTPLIRLALEDWPIDNLASSVAMNGASLDSVIEKYYRGFDDMMMGRLDPPMNMPDNLNDDTVNAFSAKKRIHLKTDRLDSGNIKPLLPYQHYQVNVADLTLLQRFEDQRDYIIGRPQMQALAQAQQIPSTKTFEQFIQLAGPMTTFISKNVEEALLECGEMVMYLIFQFATAKRRFEILGRNGLTKEDFQYDPNMLPIPRTPSPNAPASISVFPTTQMDRVREHGKRFYFRITAGSAYKLTDKSRQLMILNLSRDPRIPFSPWFVCKQFDIDIGGEPTHLKSDYEKYLWHMKNMAEFSSALQAQAALTQAQVQLAIQQMIQEDQMRQQLEQGGMLGGLLGMMGQTDGQTEQPPYPNAPQDPTQRVGRPSSNQESPRLETKDGGTRTTISTS